MTPEDITKTLTLCKDSYNGRTPAAGYDELKDLIVKEIIPRVKSIDTIIELGPAYSLLPSILLGRNIKKYVGVEPFLFDRTKLSIKYMLSFHELKDDRYKLFNTDALSFFQEHPEKKGLIVSADVLTRSVIGAKSNFGTEEQIVQNNLLLDTYSTELANKIYAATPEGTFTAHLYIDKYFTEKLLKAGFKKEENFLFSR